MKQGVICFIVGISSFIYTSTFAQSADETSIRKILSNQEDAWNRGDINDFMQGYWKSDSLLFIGKSGVTNGWQKTLNNYKKNYPDTAAMGVLNFELLQLKPLSAEYYFVIGKWHLQRTVGDLGGHFTLLFKKINGVWLIVTDHSS
ncbi:MAG: DUF4440 domain-containing protein [Ginsengibacter sp.]